MKIVIIEDERIAATDLKETIMETDPTAEIVAVLRSVQDGLAYFNTHSKPDLIFSDIQLGDGLSFEVLENLRIPVVFCTAYDEYALNAFKSHGIDYILKPFNHESVSNALLKYKNLVGTNQDEITRQYDSIKSMLAVRKSQKIGSLLIYHKDYVFPLNINEVAVLYLHNEIVILITFNGSRYYPGKSLEELESVLGDNFFRANRQYLVNRRAVLKASSLLTRRLSLSISVDLEDIITISREKAPIFLKWLAGSSSV